MKALLALFAGILGMAGAEPKTRVFITESGALQFSVKSVEVSGPTSPENIEVMRAFLKYCPAVAVTGDKDKADYVIRLDRETPSPVTPFVRGNKVAVFNREADLIYSDSRRLLAPVVKGACAAILGRR
jgi:hypothetical protein